MQADPEGAARELLQAGFVIAGTADDLIPTLDAFAHAGIDQLILHMQMGGVSHEDIARSIRVMGSEVIPRYR